MCSLTNTDDEQLIEAVSNHSASYDLKHQLVEVSLESHTTFAENAVSNSSVNLTLLNAYKISFFIRLINQQCSLLNSFTPL